MEATQKGEVSTGLYFVVYTFDFANDVLPIITRIIPPDLAKICMWLSRWTNDYKERDVGADNIDTLYVKQ